MIEEIVESRGVKEILHFTTNKGVLGILDSKCVRARKRLDNDARLEYIFTPNAALRTRDKAWLDYVNLSVSRLNTEFFSVSARQWHAYKDFWWCVLAFSPEILSHEGVWFTTTNNIYTGVRRETGGVGLEGMFAREVVRWNANIVRRNDSMPRNFTTCEQAEVLYPGEILTKYLEHIYVANDEVADELAGQMSAVMHPELDIKIAPELFSAIN